MEIKIDDCVNDCDNVILSTWFGYLKKCIILLELVGYSRILAIVVCTGRITRKKILSVWI